MAGKERGREGRQSGKGESGEGKEEMIHEPIADITKPTMDNPIAAAVETYQETMKAIKAQLGDQIFAPPDSGRYYSKAYEKAEKRAWMAYQQACETAHQPKGETNR